MSAPPAMPPSHPAPRRRQIAAGTLLFGLLAAPAAWFTLELGGWGLASWHCAGHAAPVAAQLERASTPSFVALACAALALALVGTWTAWRVWERTRDEKPDDAHDLVQLGEGRTRFIALASLIASTGFTAALLFDAIHMWLAPLCGG